MSYKNFKYHKLTNSVGDSLLIANGYPKKTDCNRNGTGIDGSWGNEIIFGSKTSNLESDFDSFVIEKDKDYAWAKTTTESLSWRPLE